MTSSRSRPVSTEDSRTWAGTTNPGGTGRPSATIIARLAPLPPASRTSRQASSSNQRMVAACSSVIEDGHRPHRGARGSDPLYGEDGELESRGRELVEVHEVLDVPVVLLPHDPVRLPELLALEHGPHGRVEGDGVYAHEPYTPGDQVQCCFPRHSAVVGEVALIVVVRRRAGLDQDYVSLLELVADLLQRLLYLGGADPGSVLLVTEVQDDAVGEAVLQRYALGPGGVGLDVLEGVHVGPGVVALDDEVGGGEHVHAVLVGADAPGEVLPGIVHQEARRRDAREGNHVPVHGHGQIHQTAHA